ncbi:LacI family DNA-binding transcriptional regulator [Roseisalinus antarcticus]|uniref:Catabolite control protein A n=1 Tax=Roseisalinus antarcticus TaxID=254357 RepID=A0A1Y5RPB8_9RHOB|nr:LacI family DNA-binding transcriptional regulator [Roseisalinus antarcticus]SLN21046.1 Catabolite control protein A [Roseisalinus antarcticus]
MPRAVTLKDIARETGVHVSTVSRALDPRARDSLTVEVVKKVNETAQRLGYRPNRLAAGLRTKRTRTVGLIIPDITNPLFPPIVRGVESILEPLGYVSIIVNTDGRQDRERSQMQVLLEHGVDGVVHAAMERDASHYTDLQDRNVPIVTVNRRLDVDGLPSVVNDDAEGIHEMFRLLYEAGHRRIAHIAGPPTISTGVERLAAFREAAKAFGVSVPDAYIVESEKFLFEEGHRCAAKLMALADPPTAILAANDGLALGAIQLLRDRGLGCPEDVSVTGFNNSDVLSLVPPGLTTVGVDKTGIGKASATLLISRIDNPEDPETPHLVQPIEVVIRGSIAPPPRAGRQDPL